MMLKEWKEFYRSSLFLMVILFVVLSSWFVLYQFRGVDVPVSFRTGLIPLFQTSVYFLPLLTMLYGAFSMVQEQNQRTLIMLTARGMTIPQFVLQKCLSLLAVFLPTIIFAYFISMFPAKIVFGTFSLPEFIYFLFAIVIICSIFLVLGVFLGALIQKKFKLIGATIGVWLALIYLFDLVLMYWLSAVSIDQVLLFSIIYFLSPINAVQYFLFVKLNVYQLSNLSVIYEQFTFQSPGIVLLGNMALWLGISFFASIYVLKRKGVSHD